MCRDKGGVCGDGCGCSRAKCANRVLPDADLAVDTFAEYQEAEGSPRRCHDPVQNAEADAHTDADVDFEHIHDDLSGVGELAGPAWEGVGEGEAWDAAHPSSTTTTTTTTTRPPVSSGAVASTAPSAAASAFAVFEDPELEVSADDAAAGPRSGPVSAKPAPSGTGPVADSTVAHGRGAGGGGGGGGGGSACGGKARSALGMAFGVPSSTQTGAPVPVPPGSTLHPGGGTGTRRLFNPATAVAGTATTRPPLLL